MDARRARSAARREAIVQAIARHQSEQGRPATYADLIPLTGISSTSMLAYHVNILVREKRIRRQAGSRGLTVEVPLVGAHLRVINAIAAVGQGRPVPLPAIVRHIVDSEPFGAGILAYITDATAVVIDDLSRRGYLMGTGRGYVVITEPQT